MIRQGGKEARSLPAKDRAERVVLLKDYSLFTTQGI